MQRNKSLFRCFSLVLSVMILISAVSFNSFAEYSVYKADGITAKNNAFLNGNDTAIIYIPGYRCSNLEMNVDLNNDGESEKVVCFAVGSEVFDVSDDNGLVKNFIGGFGNLLISATMLLTNYFRNDNVTVSQDGGFGIADIYVQFFNDCVEKFGDDSDIIIYDLDWRQELSITVNDLYSMIQQLGYKKVILVTQSMGGLIASGTAKLLTDDLKDGNPENDVELYTVNVGAAFFGSFDFFYNNTDFEGIEKISSDYFTYLSKIDFPSHSQLGVPPEYATLYGNEYAVAKIEKPDGTVIYEDINPDEAYSVMNELCQDLDLLTKFYNDYIFVDHDENSETPAVHIMETLGTDAYYISGTSSATPSSMQIEFIEDSQGNRTPVRCVPVINDSTASGDGVLTAACSTLSFSSPETTFYVPFDHKTVLFNSDTYHLVFDILSHVLYSSDELFDYQDTDYVYSDIYSQPITDAVSKSDNLLYPQVVTYILGLFGIKIPFEVSLKICNFVFSLFNT